MGDKVFVMTSIDHKRAEKGGRGIACRIAWRIKQSLLHTGLPKEHIVTPQLEEKAY